MTLFEADPVTPLHTLWALGDTLDIEPIYSAPLDPLATGPKATPLGLVLAHIAFRKNVRAEEEDYIIDCLLAILQILEL